jgi:hypothetical protein
MAKHHRDRQLRRRHLKSPWNVDHREPDDTPDKQAKRDNLPSPVIGSRLTEIECPSCNQRTTFLLVNGKYGVGPSCESCFLPIIDRLIGPVKAGKDRFEIHFLPAISQTGKRPELVSEPRRYDFKDLHLYLKSCLGEESFVIKRPESNGFTHTSDILLKLCDRLSELAEQYDLVEKAGQLLPEVKDAKQVRTRKRIAENIRTQISDRTVSNEIRPMKKLEWEMLPQGPHPFREIQDYLQDLGARDSSFRYDLGRLTTIYENLIPCLKEKPDIYVGTTEFRGYIVFHLQKSNVAILECPVVGNAIYILKGDWQSLSTKPKAILLQEYQGRTERIIHTGDWYGKLLNRLTAHRAFE